MNVGSWRAAIGGLVLGLLLLVPGVVVPALWAGGVLVIDRDGGEVRYYDAP